MGARRRTETFILYIMPRAYMGLGKRLAGTAACAAVFGIVLFAVSYMIMPAVQYEIVSNEHEIRDGMQAGIRQAADTSEYVITEAGRLSQDALTAAEPHVTGATSAIGNLGNLTG